MYVRPDRTRYCQPYPGQDERRELPPLAFDAGQGLTEHTSPFDAYMMVLEGELLLTIGGHPVRATPGTIVRMPAGVPHGLEAPAPARMLLIMLRERTDG